MRRTMTPDQIVARNVARARELRSWTQEQAAEALAPYLGARLSGASFSALERPAVSVSRIKQFSADDLLLRETFGEVVDAADVLEHLAELLRTLDEKADDPTPADTADGTPRAGTRRQKSQPSADVGEGFGGADERILGRDRSPPGLAIDLHPSPSPGDLRPRDATDAGVRDHRKALGCRGNVDGELAGASNEVDETERVPGSDAFLRSSFRSWIACNFVATSAAKGDAGTGHVRNRVGDSAGP